MAEGDYHRPDNNKIQALKDLANKLRIHSIEATNASNSGHPTSCCSMAEIMSVLFFHTMKYKVTDPRNANNDRFILSKGHAAPILYAAWAEAGLFPSTELLKLRKISSDLEGHPTPRLNFVDVATGSLGQGLGCGCGMAYTGKYFDKASYRTYCVIGDGESAEGSVWEALAFASHYKLDNLVAVIDVNRLGQSAATAYEHDTEVYKKRLEAFGWNTYVVDGHDIEALCKAFHDASTVKGKPSAIVAKTLKGKGIEGVEDLLDFHGKPMGAKADTVIAHLRSQIAASSPTLCPNMPVKEDCPVLHDQVVKMDSPPNYKPDDSVATRKAYGTALAKIGHDRRVVALDGDVGNSTFSIDFQKKYPDRYIQCYIAEQNLVAVGIGCGTRERTIPFMSTFAAFFERAHDQIRMGAISMTNINLAGSHCGVSIGDDGPSQMALEDIATFRAIPGSTVFYPSDAVSAERAVELCANTKGICFIRTSRPAAPILYSNDEVFEIGKAKVVRQSDSDKVTIVASAVTFTESMKAADELKAAGINVRLIDPFTIKPIDKETILAAAKATGGKVLTVEDHYPEGGIGEAVAGALSDETGIIVHKMAVNGLPRSGKPAELLDMFQISAPHIVKKVKQILA